ncbi:unnamed protein product [Spirodela intermedia]|uniref:Uncharacterized protein n=1 Tax=Spirodela intermedia TaxID=51605 RepID=A0A7I8IN93_SPIIN|nr:unnamed protein product [Spirodela intermedia]CAA6659325.1 unnamed protein product [Spirodela intermedia]
MPIALERGGSGRSDGEGIIRRSGCGAGGDSPAGRSAVMALRIGLVMPATGMEKEEEANSCSSSIGRNSDCSGGSAGMDEEESGEAEFYAGKSRSFTSLAEVSSSSSTKDLAKPQNAYTRKRKNLLAFSINWDRHHNSAPLASTRGSTPRGRPAPAAAAATRRSRRCRRSDRRPIRMPNPGSLPAAVPPTKVPFLRQILILDRSAIRGRSSIIPTANTWDSTRQPLLPPHPFLLRSDLPLPMKCASALNPSQPALQRGDLFGTFYIHVNSRSEPIFLT